MLLIALIELSVDADPIRELEVLVAGQRRYRAIARWYDILSGEAPLYRAGRVAGIRLLSARRGGVVLDLGCGTFLCSRQPSGVPEW